MAAAFQNLTLALLVISDASADDPNSVFYLSDRDYRIGRGTTADIQLDSCIPFVSRQHATLMWDRDRDGFTIVDDASTHGTYVDGSRLEPGKRFALTHGCQLSFGELPAVFVVTRRNPTSPDLLRLIREMNSLDISIVIPRALELLRLVAGVEEGRLVSDREHWLWPGPSIDPHIDDLSAFTEDPSLRVSRSSIEKALRTGQKVACFVTADGEDLLTSSMKALDLQRIWVSPVLAVDDRPIAAVYVHSSGPGPAFDPATEMVLDAVVDQIGMAIRNAWLHREVINLSEDLELRVIERTRQLEESQAKLVSQDRLATLGRLIAAIAHELNNPAGAIASLSETQRRLLESMLRVESDLDMAFPDPNDAEIAREFLHSVLSGTSDPLDTRTRRRHENELTEILTASDVPGAEVVARRLARSGVGAQQLGSVMPVLKRSGGALSELSERVATFARGIETIRGAAGNIARIVDGLKTYSHLDRAEFEEVDIHRTIDATLSVLASRMESIRVETQYADIPPFPHRPGEITQVWTNLIDNAIRAMGETGTLTVETREVGDLVRITVTDTGPGIDSAVADRVFDLDVTTRGPGAGLGMGLPICRSIIEENHGGRITFESVPGRTVFRVDLPKRPPPKESST